MSSSYVLTPDINLQGVGFAILLSSLQELHCAVTQLKELENNLGEKCKIDFAITNPAGELIGVRANEKGEAEFLPQNCESAATKATLQKIKQTYARLKTLNELKQKGYRVAKEETLANGSIRIVVEKWR